MDSWPAWSPDASQIAFVRNDQVLLVSPLGGGERMVAESAGRVAWTLDGSALLVLQKTSALGTSIFRVTLASGEKQRLTFPNDTTSRRFGFVDFTGRTHGGVQQGSANDWIRAVCDAGGGGEVHQLTNDHAQVLGMAWTRGLPRGCVFFDAAEFVSTVAHPGAAGEPRGVFRQPETGGSRRRRRRLAVDLPQWQIGLPARHTQLGYPSCGDRSRRGRVKRPPWITHPS